MMALKKIWRVFLKESYKAEAEKDLDAEKSNQENFEMEVIESGNMNKPSSPVENIIPEKYLNGKFAFMMGVDEFLSYKTLPCEEQMKCKSAPTVRRGIVIGVRKKEIKCPYWHNMEDRRRELFDKKGNLLYGHTSCENREDCVKGDNCKQAHNFFETSYHPLKYKKGRCALLKSCKNAKYCPYSHSNEEQKAWSNIVKEYFNLQEEEDEIAWADSGDEADVERYGPPEKPITAPPCENADNVTSPTPNIFNNSKNQQDKIANMKPTDPELFNKELHGTLKVRKEFTEAKILTPLFENNVCFQHFPLLFGENLSNKVNSENNSENK